MNREAVAGPVAMSHGTPPGDRQALGLDGLVRSRRCVDVEDEVRPKGILHLVFERDLEPDPDHGHLCTCFFDDRGTTIADLGSKNRAQGPASRLPLTIAYST